MITANQIDACTAATRALPADQAAALAKVARRLADWTPLGENPFRTPQLAAGCRATAQALATERLATALRAGRLAEGLAEEIQSLPPRDRANFRTAARADIAALGITPPE